MNREEKALLANISTIIVKDMLIDKKNIMKPLENHFLFDDDDSEDDLDYFIYEMEKKKRMRLLLNKNKHREHVEKYDELEDNDDISEMETASNVSSAKEVSEEIMVNSVKTNEIETDDKTKNEISSFDFGKIDEEIFEQNLHMTKKTYDKTIESLSVLFRKKITSLDKISELEKTKIIPLGLWKIITDEHSQEVIRRFRECGFTTNSFALLIKEFYNVLSTNFKLFAKWPTTKELQQETIDDFRKLDEFKNFPNCFGILVTKQIPVFLETKNEEISLIFQLACKSNGIITYCQVNYVDSFSFNDTALGKLIRNENYLPSDGNYYFLADEGYPLEKTIIKMFKEANCDNKVNFNTKHTNAIKVGKNVIQNLQQRFHILLGLEAQDMQEVQKIFKTICILHNLCVKNNDTYHFNSTSLGLDKNNSDKNDIVEQMDMDEDGVEKRLELLNNF